VLQHFANLGSAVIHEPDIAPGEARVERDCYEDAALRGRLDEALRRLNPGVPGAALDALKALPAVWTIFCATADPVGVLAAQIDSGRGIFGVVDGHLVDRAERAP